jgi:carboxyl-terminal processing protease
LSSNARNVLIGLTTVLIAVMLVATGFLARVVTEPEASLSAAAAATGADAGATPSASDAADFAILGEIAKVLEGDFVDPSRVDPELLLNGAILGLFNTLNDPHSTYIDPDTYALSHNDFEGAFEGIGATVSQQDNYVVIVRTIEDTPAERAGILAGDVILAVDGESAENWSVQQAVIRIRGPRGTTVELKVRHTDGSEETFSIERDDIPVASVDALPPGGVLLDHDGNTVDEFAYIRIRQFSRNTPTELLALIQEAEAQGKLGLIIDVRSNPGGLLNETVQIADMFLDRGVIYSQVDRAGNKRTAEASPGTLTDLPVIILQDEFSASGSELFAAALQENGRAQVVGTQSFGKGTVNHAVELSNGGAVYVSIARWLTPAGHQIEGRGVTPDVEIALTLADIEAGRDVAMFRAINLLRGEPIPVSTATPTVTPAATATTAP